MHVCLFGFVNKRYHYYWIFYSFGRWICKKYILLFVTANFVAPFFIVQRDYTQEDTFFNALSLVLRHLSNLSDNSYRKSLRKLRRFSDKTNNILLTCNVMKPFQK